MAKVAIGKGFELVVPTSFVAMREETEKEPTQVLIHPKN